MTSRRSDRRRWPDSLAAGFLAGALGGFVFLAVALVRDGADVLAYWPSAAFAAWLMVRSVATYALVFGAIGALLAVVLHLPRWSRSRVFALVLAAMTTLTVLAYLSAWWQIEVLAGLPMGDPGRWRAALWHGLAALAAGAVAGVLTLLTRRFVVQPSRLHSEQAGGLRLDSGPTRPAILVLASAVLLLIAGEVGLGRSGPGAGEPIAGRPSQVVVVGLDGMTLRVLSPLLRAGELPVFRRLMAEGAWGTFLTYGTASSPQVWTSMATGKRVRDHGIADFVQTHGGKTAGPPRGGQMRGYRAELMRSTDRRARAIWNVLSGAGRRVAVVDWLVTFPPEEVNGYLVSRLKLDAEGRTHPPGLDAELAALWDERPEGGVRLSASGGTRAQLLWNVDRVFAAASHLLDKEPLDFLAVYDATADRVEHRNWKYYQAEAFDPELWGLTPRAVDPAAAAELSSLIPDVYRHLDRRLGELLAQAAGDALVLVVSDHGQRAAKRPRVRLRLDRVLEALGYARLVPGAGRRDQVDYPASRAYTLVETPWTPVLRVNLNLRGREARGIVDPGDAVAVAEQLAEALRGVRFEDGTPLFTAVDVRLRDGLDRRRGADLRVALSRHARGLGRSAERLVIGDAASPLGISRILQRRAGGKDPLAARPGFHTSLLAHYQSVNPVISGAHDHQGVIFARGPGVEPGYIGQRVVSSALHDLLWHLTDKVDAVDRLLPVLRRLGWIERASTLDLTPTVLHALGLPVARDMFGRPVTGLFSEPPEVEWIASYETGGEPRIAGEEEPPPTEPPSEDPSDEEALERLRALGYVD